MASIAEAGPVRSPWRLSWTAIIAGALLAIAAHIVLGLIGAALGLAASPSDSTALGVGAAAWALLTPFVASLLGAWFASRMCGAADGTTSNVHGILVWCIGLVAGALFLTGTLASGAMTAGTAASGNAGVAERMRREVTGTPRPSGREAQARSEDAAKAAAAGTGGAALASLAGLLGAIVGSGLAIRRGGRKGGWRAMLDRRHGDAGRHAEGERYATRAPESRPYAPGTERGTGATADVPPPSDPFHH